MLCFEKERRGGGNVIIKGVRGCLLALCISSFVLEFWSRFRGGGKGSDEEHITYSGGKEIFDLLRCG